MTLSPKGLPLQVIDAYMSFVQRVDQMLQDVSNQCPSFRFSKEEVRNVLRDVAEFKAPGIYVLSEYLLRHEFPALQKKFGGQKECGGSVGSNTVCLWRALVITCIHSSDQACQAESQSPLQLMNSGSFSLGI